MIEIEKKHKLIRDVSQDNLSNHKFGEERLLVKDLRRGRDLVLLSPSMAANRILALLYLSLSSVT